MARRPKLHIFINYRRTDSGDFAEHLYNYLRDHFNPENIFKDTHAIRPGEDFQQAIERSVKTCDVFLALIGDNWLPILQERTKGSEPDFVRIEIQTALANDIPIIPIVINHAPMPPATAQALNELEPLTQKQALRIVLSDEVELIGADKLVNHLKKEFNRDLPQWSLFILVFMLPILLLLSRLVVPNADLQLGFVVAVNTIIILMMLAINEWIRPVRWPWRTVAYFFVPLMLIAILTFATYSFYFVSNPVRILAPELVSYGNHLPTIASYGSNAQALDIRMAGNNPPPNVDQFLHFKLQLQCIDEITRCDAGIILGNLTGVSNPLVEELVFKIRGELGNEIVGLSLKDNLQVESRIFSIADYIVSEQKTISTQWQAVRIPFSEFQGIQVEQLDLISFFIDADYTLYPTTSIDVAELHLD